MQSAVKRVDDLVDAEADFGGFRVASPGRSGGVGASGRRLSKRDKNSRKTNRIAPSIMGKYLGGSEGASQHGLGRADARKVAGVLGRPLTMYAVTWNLAGKLPPASIGTIAPTQEVDVIAVGTQECLVNCGSVKSFVQPGKAKWEQRLQAVCALSTRLYLFAVVPLFARALSVRSCVLSFPMHQSNHVMICVRSRWESIECLLTTFQFINKTDQNVLLHVLPIPPPSLTLLHGFICVCMCLCVSICVCVCVCLSLCVCHRVC